MFLGWQTGTKRPARGTPIDSNLLIIQQSNGSDDLRSVAQKVGKNRYQRKKPIVLNHLEATTEDSIYIQVGNCISVEKSTSYTFVLVRLPVHQ